MEEWFLGGLITRRPQFESGSRNDSDMQKSKISQATVCKLCNKEFVYKRSTKPVTKPVACNSCAVQKLRHVYKRRAIELLGGCCKHCGYNRSQSAMDFHHVDPSQKEVSISSNGITRSWARIEKELQKCILLCSNCHREEHARLNPPRYE